MDIDKFDRLYPSPAHAAAADWSDRYLTRRLEPESRSSLTDRSGVVVGVAALVAALLSGTVYVLMAGKTAKTSRVERTIQLVAAVPVVKRLPPLRPVSPITAERTVTLRHTTVAVSQVRSAPQRIKPTHAKAGSSGWILDPLSGDALAAALVVDKQRTIELNAQQLGKMTKGDIRPPHAVDAEGSKDPNSS